MDKQHRAREHSKAVKDDRWLWLMVRRGLLLICAAIEQRFGIDPPETEASPPPHKPGNVG